MATSGFALTRDQIIPEVSSRARLWRHLKSGAEVLSLENDDDDRAFGIIFRLPPPDATGLTHVLEHAVLSGSRRYPVHDPLGEVLKGSLVTYVNALTFPDKTGYLVASRNAADLRNVADVFLDAVFHPLLTEQAFKRHGWHYELEGLDAPLTLNGIVLNEQRGNFSSPARLIEHHSQMPLFPDTPYGVPRGGDPAEIPKLTYERLVAYHRTFYHPSNARLFFYGDMDPEAHLRTVDTWLRDFDRREVPSAVPLQRRFDHPRSVTIPYAADQGNGMVTVNWVLDEVGDPELMLSLEILTHILLGTPASPLRQVLIESGLGKDLTGVGLFTHVRQMYLSTGLSGIDPGDAPRVEALIDETLRRLYDGGIDPDVVTAALNTVGFELREAPYGHLPRGLALLWHRASTTWVHDGDPLALLAFEAPLAAIARRAGGEKRFFEGLLSTYLMDNSHRATVLLAPDPGLDPGASERHRLERVRAGLDRGALAALVADTDAFRRTEALPEPPAALAAIPALTLEDVSAEPLTMPCSIHRIGGALALQHDAATRGIVYLDLAFDLHTLPQELVPYAPIFGRALLEMGTTGEVYGALARRIGNRTGGLTSTILTSAAYGRQVAVGRLVLRGKATVAGIGDLVAILHDLLTNARLDQRRRFAQLVLEARAALASDLLPRGTDFVGTRLGARYGEAGWLAEQTTGIEQLWFLDRLASEVEEDWPTVLSALEAVHRALLRQSGLVCSVTLESEHWERVASPLSALITALPDGAAPVADWTPTTGPAFEALSVPASVNFVGKGANLYAGGYALHGSIAVIRHTIQLGWLMEKIRGQGGAYGAGCTFDPASGVFAYLSYRDPHLLRTLTTYDRTVDYLSDLTWTEAERVRTVVGAVGRLDDVDGASSPDDRGTTSLMRYLRNEREEDRRRFRREALNTTLDDVRAFADVLKYVRDEGSVVVMGSSEAIAAANVAFGGRLAVTAAS